MVGYSQTPLWKKLGIKPAFRVKTGKAPADYSELLGVLPDGAIVSSRLAAPVDIVHLFARLRADLERRLLKALETIRQDGAIWVSWPKKASGMATDLTEDVVRDVALPLTLVDIKVCAVDDTWSGLKLVIRRRHRR